MLFDLFPSHDKWFERIDEVANAIAKARDCSEVYIVGRAGWQRKLKQLGFRLALNKVLMGQ